MALNFLMKRTAIASKRPEPSSMALGELDVNYDADTGGLFYKNSTGGVVKVGPPQLGTTAPNSIPAGSAGNSVGEFWFDTSVPQLKIWNGSAWVNTTNAASTSQSGVVQLEDSTSSTSTTTAATPNAVKSAYDLANAAIPNSVFNSKGDIIIGTGNDTYGNFPTGTNGQVLTADSACTEGVKWNTITQCTGTVTSVAAGAGLTGGTITGTGTLCLNTACVIQPTIFTAKGSIISASAVSTPAALAVGTNGQMLVADSACTTGLKWAAPTADIPCSTLTAKGTLISASAASTPTALPVGTNGQMLYADSACTTGLKWAAAPADVPCSALTAKGAIITATAASTPTALLVGTNGQVLTACSTCSTGLMWATPAGGAAAIPCSCLLAKGSIIAASAASTPCNVPIGGDGRVLTADSTQTAGVSWCLPGSLAFGSWGVGNYTLCAGNGANTFNVNFGFCTICTNMGWSISTPNIICFCCAGVYQINFCGGFSSVPPGYLCAEMFCNANQCGATIGQLPSNTGYTVLSISCMMRMNPGDCIRYTSASFNVAAGCWYNWSGCGKAVSLDINRIAL